MQEIENSKVQWKRDGDTKHLYKLSIDETRLQALVHEENRAYYELTGDVATARGFSEEVCKETDETKILELINDENDKKSSIFDFDLEKLWNTFESSDGITKLVWVLMFSSSAIFSSVFGIMLNLYGNYLLDRFKLEDKYPKVAIFIKYRRNLSKYYILSNFLSILLICIGNIILGLSILSL